MRSTRPRVVARLGATFVGALVAGPLLLTGTAYAATGSIDHVQPRKGDLEVVMSLSDLPDGAKPDLATVTVTMDDEPVEASAQRLTGSTANIRRTAMLALDVSSSMQGAKFEEAKAAANAFLDDVPDDVYVGLVTFAGDVTVAQEPTQHTDAVRSVLDKLQLSKQTRLYDGVKEAVQASGLEGARSILVLSDGRDTSETTLESATTAVKNAKVKVDVVALGQRGDDKDLLQQIADSGNGQVLDAGDPRALRAVFAKEAKALAQQVLVTVTPPAEMAGREGTLSVTLQVNDTPVTDHAFVALPAPDEQAGGGEVGGDLPRVEPGFQVPKEWMYGGLAAAALGVVVVLLLALGGSPDLKQDAVDRNIEAYTRKGARKLAEANRQTEPQSVTQQAVAVAENVLEGQQGLEATLNDRLEAAGLALKPAEWLLIHFALTVGFGIFALLLGGGSLLFTLVGLLLGVALPWVYLSVKKRRRLAAFKAQLADVLQLMSGSLSAGLSLAQSVDTVVREGTDPIAGEFRRALMETRLGVEIEDALNGVAERMESVDFEWVVMAIRIQREVGGNLAELLNKVAETIREREYLVRQVLTLSAEGRLSVWILGGLPPAFMAYLAVANPGYIQPMFTSPLGWVMLTVMSILLTGGIFWMKKVVKVEV